MTDPGAARPPRGMAAVARVGRSHGLEGVVRVHPEDNAALEALIAAPRVWVEGLGFAAVRDLKPHGAHWLLRLDRLRRVEVAKELVHATVYVDPRDLPAAVAAALDREVAGLPVLVDGRPFGAAIAVEGPPLQPLLRVRGPVGELLLPLAAGYVRVDDDAVRVVDPPAGLLDES